jgi:hypothetical protein
MKEKAKRVSRPILSSWAKREIIGFIVTVSLVVLVIAFFRDIEYLYSPPDRYLTWSTDSHYLALIRNNADFIVYDLVEQTETLQPKLPNALSARDFYDNKHLWIASNGIGTKETQFLNYNVETQMVDSTVSPDYRSFPQPDSRFSINPDKTLLVYASHNTTTYNDNPLYKTYDLLQIDLITLKVKQITSPFGKDAPQYASDGSLVAGTSILKDGTWREIPNFASDKIWYSLSPDGQWILDFEWRFDFGRETETPDHVTSQNNKEGIYLLPLDGHVEPQRIQSWPVEEIVWSPNGCYIAYTQAYPPNFAIVLASDWGLGKFVQPGADCKPYKAQ